MEYRVKFTVTLPHPVFSFLEEMRVVYGDRDMSEIIERIAVEYQSSHGLEQAIATVLNEICVK